MTTQQGHRIALVNFLPEDVEALEKAGFHGELGYIGRQTEAGIPYSFKRPLYEYDVYVYDGTLSPEVVKLYPSPRDFWAASASLSVATRPRVRIALIGPNTPVTLYVAGMPFIRLANADRGLSDIISCRNDSPFICPELEECVGRMRKNVRRPIYRYISYQDSPALPGYTVHHFPLMVNRNNDVIAAYGTVFNGSVKPVYIALPLFNDNTRALVELLNTLAEMHPELFPDRPTKRSWLRTSQFAFSEELAIDEEIEQRKAELTRFVEEKQADRASVGRQYDFMRKVLVATEDAVEPSERLSANVRASLEYLGFKVTDVDAIRGPIKKEDFWAEDSDFLAIVEVTATRGKNPKNKEFSDILGRMSTIYRRQDIPDASRITGLLILNYDLENHPFRRPRVYTGDAEEIAQAAKDHDIGLLSTVDLYRILIDVKEGRLAREGSRELLKQSGRIEYRPNEPSTPSTNKA